MLLRYAATIAILGLLTACFVSREALITDDNAAYPIEAGIYAYHEAEPDNPEDGHELEWQGPVTIKQGAYASSHEPDDFPYQGARFAEMGDGSWIAQHPPAPQDDGYTYTLLHADPDHEGRFYMEWVVCEPLAEKIQSTLGIELDDDVCIFEDFDTLKAGMQIWIDNRASMEELPEFPTGLSYLERVE